jgi:hypothetical protein
MSVLPERRLLKAIALTSLVLFTVCTVSYLFLLGAQVYSVLRVSRVLDRVERLRPGDPYTDYKSVISGCKTSETTGSGSYCHVVAGAFRSYLTWQLLQKVSDSLFDRIFATTSHMGLRYWDVLVSAAAKDDRLTNVSVRLYVVGRYEALGATWTRAATIPALYHGVALAPQDQQTYMHWYHITSMPSGEVFSVSTSNGSTEAELQARHFNRACLLSSRGCDGLCELFPYAIPVLNERHRSWGGWCSVPRSWCASKVETDRVSE